jgi:hypothetical protein
MFALSGCRRSAVTEAAQIKYLIVSVFISLGIPSYHNDICGKVLSTLLFK